MIICELLRMLRSGAVFVLITTLLVDQTQSQTASIDVTAVVRSCRVDDFLVQQHFELNQYKGTWYDVANVRRDGLPQKQLSNYTLDGDYGLYMLSDGLSINEECFQQKVLAHGRLVDPSRREGKFRIHIEDVGLDEVEATSNDYWVIQTDYTSYAVVYSCQLYLDDGTCSYNHTSAWLMSRRTTLDPATHRIMVNVLEDMCIPEERISLTSQNCIETINEYTDEDDIEPNDMTEYEKCMVTNVSLQADLDFQRYMGTWYEVAKKKTAAKYQVPDSTTTFLEMVDNNTVAMQFFFKVSHMCMDVIVDGMASTDGGRLMVTFDPLGDGESKTAPYWIVETDYENYALVYGCNIKENGTCSHRENIVYVMGRKPTLSQIYIDRVNQLLPLLCIETDDIILTRPDECRELTMDTCAEIGVPSPNIGNSVGEFSRVPQSLPSLHLTPRKCNPNREAYGCCTLIDAPAVGPNGEGCPNFQEVQPAVNSVEQGKCWKESQTATQDGATYLTCNYDGTYAEVQCDTSLGACWCVDQQTGHSKPGSVTTYMEQPDCRLTNCQRHRKRIEGYQSRRNMKKKYFYRPSCEKDGRYTVIQCFDSWRYCWCVDKETGNKVLGTLAQGMLPLCNRREF